MAKNGREMKRRLEQIVPSSRTLLLSRAAAVLILRLGSTINRGDYTPVRTDENSEAATAAVSYPDPDFSGPGLSNAAVPRVVADGILCYSKELKVYIGVQFIPGAATEQQLNDIAQSLVLSPAEKP